jgi:dTDP-glucose 4,6-dehydratase
MSKTWCILGGGGSFAIHAANYILNSGDDRVVAIGRAPLRPEPFSLGIERYPRYSYCVHHLVTDLDGLLATLDREQPAVIVNFAAQGEGAISWRESWRFFETNATALVRLTEELGKRDWLERFIQIGSSEVYGSNLCAVVESDSLRPSSPYAASKAAFDMHLLAVSRHLGFPMNILRPSNCYGPGQLLHRVIPKAIVYGLTGRRLPLDGGGKSEKSYMHSADLARAIYDVAARAPVGRVYNVGPARPTSIREVVERCAVALNIEFKDLVQEAPERLGQDARYWLSSRVIYDDVGWTPAIDWNEGLAGMVAWGRQHLEVLKDWPTSYELRP